MRIRSIQVAVPTTQQFEGRSITTAIGKAPVDGEIFLSRLNLSGDAQGDLVNHGGADKAACVYSYDHYSFWEQEFGIPLTSAAFGENLTVYGWKEEDVCIGDIYQVGQALVQVSQPRKPCYKLAMKHGKADIPKKVIDTGYTGFYLRVLQEGLISVDSEIVLIQKHAEAVSVDYVNKITHHEKSNIEAIRRLLSIHELSESWRAALQKRLETP